MSNRAEQMNEPPKPAVPAVDDDAKVSRDANSKRRHVRLRMPLKVTIDGVERTISDWSMGGMQIEDIDSLPGIGSRFSADLGIPFDDFNFTLTTTCEVVWLDLNGRRVGCRFIDMKDGQIAMLRYMVDAFIAGKVATVDGVLRRAAAGEAQPLGQDLKEKLDPRPPRHVRLGRALRRAAIVGTMAAAGVLLVVLAASSISSRFLDVTSDLGWVHARAIEVRSSTSGVVAGRPVEAGATVRDGQILFELNDPDIAGQLEVAIAELGRHEEELAGLKRRLAARRTFFDEYVALAEVEERRAAARVDRANLNLSIAVDKLNRAAALHGRGFLADQALEDAENRHGQAMLERRLAEADLAQAGRNRRLAEMGFIYPQGRVDGDEPAEIRRQIGLAEQAVAVASARIDALLERQAQTVVRSPCDCRVDERMVVAGEWLELGAMAYRLTEADGPRVVKALVPQEAAGRLTIGGEALVTLADRDDPLSGRIVHIDRTPAADGGPAGIIRLASRYGLAEITIDPGELGTAHVGLPARLNFPGDIASLLPFRLPSLRPDDTGGDGAGSAGQVGGLGALAEAARAAFSLASR